MVPVPTNKHCFQFDQVAFLNRVCVHPPNGSGLVDFVSYQGL
jgi:hypothetical protein